MIIEYHQPESLAEALELLAREAPPTFPLGGGTRLNQPSKAEYAVVDLRELGLDTFQASGNSLELGATLTLGRLLAQAEAAEPKLPDGLVKALQREGTYNLRQVATVAGALVAADGRAPFALVMLAMDASLTTQPGDERHSLGDLLPLRQERLRGRLISGVSIPLNVKLAYEYVARSPADWHIVGAALAAWPSGRARLALGGYGSAPVLAFDGPNLEGLEIAAASAYSQAGDEWASAEYRSEIAAVLARRCLDQLGGE
jgi:CO/xanthine dehydrogenase FAD-binding subunit